MDSVITFGPEENLIGILSEGGKDRPSHRRPAVIILNAGLVHRVGPNRIYVELSRLLARQGMEILRFDFSGIGDSQHRQDNLPAIKSSTQEVGFAMDFLAQERKATEFILIGLCSGAGVAFLSALEDQRVVGAVMINTQAPETQIGEGMELSSFYLHNALFSSASWIKFFFGKSRYRHIWKGIVTRIQLAFFQKSVIKSESEDVMSLLKTAFRNFKLRGLQLLMITSGKEVGSDYIRRIITDEVKAMEDAELLQFIRIPEADHTFTPRDCQERLFNIILKWLSDYTV